MADITKISSNFLFPISIYHFLRHKLCLPLLFRAVIILIYQMSLCLFIWLEKQTRNKDPWTSKCYQLFDFLIKPCNFSQFYFYKSSFFLFLYFQLFIFYHNLNIFSLSIFHSRSPSFSTLFFSCNRQRLCPPQIHMLKPNCQCGGDCWSGL